MNRTRYLQIIFDQKIQAYEIAAFRGAIIHKTNKESDLFHNHLGDKQYIYRYPLIQYKINQKRPSIICLKEATDDIHYLLRLKDFDLQLNGKKISFNIEDMRLRYVNIQTWDKPFHYNIHNYMALNQDNFEAYKKLEGLVAKLSFLEELLKKHIMIFATEMGAYLPEEIKVQLTEIKGEKFIEYKKVFHLTFSLNFKTNLYIPDHIGIGKGSSVGFGIIKKIGDGR